MANPLHVAAWEPPDASPALTVIAVHGRGSNEEDLLGLGRSLGLPVRVIAPRGPLTLPLGWTTGYAWYHFAETGQPEPASFRQSLDLLAALVEDVKGRYALRPEALVLLGFSQGAVMSLAAALTVPGSIGGVAALSGYFPRPDGWEAPHRDLRGLPVLVTHGTYDDILPVEWGREAAETLRDRNARVRYEEFPMAHQVNPDCLRTVSEWLKERAQAAGGPGMGAT
ncbi:MAG: phospholipase [Firmicutes bacterium]|nr:phospholipase [Bacillota bacterium]